MTDRATWYAIGNRLCGSAAGLVTAALVAYRFSPVLQGYYFTFMGLLTLTTLAELGLAHVLQQFASHEWARLERRENTDETQKARWRLAELERLASRWYGGVALVLFLGLGFLGSLYFERFRPASGAIEHWRLLWWGACLATSASVLLTPVLAILEGLNQVERVYGARLAQALAGRFVSWAAILTGGGLLAIPLSRIATLLTGVLALREEALRILRGLWTRQAPAVRTTSLSWRHEVWPLQWRFAVSWIGGYLAFSLFTPVLFAFHGPEVAGRMGMTVMFASAISSVAFAVVATKVPRLAILAAQREYEAMDALFRRVTLGSLAIVSGGAVVFCGGVAALELFGSDLAGRFLSPVVSSLFLGAIVLQQLRFALASYLRAHKKEPLVLVAIVEGAAALVVLTGLGKLYGSLGMIAGFFALSTVTLVLTLVIFQRCRGAWHTPRGIHGGHSGRRAAALGAGVET